MLKIYLNFQPKQFRGKTSLDRYMAQQSLMFTAKSLSEKYEDNFKVVSKYVHATSRGHDFVTP